jgi:putative oxygen-independent coproporphyrinogen III oxidase
MATMPVPPTPDLRSDPPHGGEGKRGQPVRPHPDKDESGFGVYVHWPFCMAKCPYCDFNSHVRHQPVDQPRFAAAFAREMAMMRERTGQRTVSSIFLGGGTPSLMQPETVASVLNEIARNWHVPGDIEITLEANPTSVEADRFRGYRAAGVNRVSLGVQALNDPDLRRLGRMHNVDEALVAIRLAREIFPRLSFDLIYARPDQSIEAWRDELAKAISYAADHLSLYQLTIEEGTPFYNLWKAGKLVTPDGEHAAALYAETQDVTAQHGLPAYEISNHAVPGAESQHNLVYWRYGEYVGVGPGAHGRFIENGTRAVTITERDPETWVQKVEAGGHGVVEEEFLTHDQEGDEFLLMGLRLVEGIDLDRYERLTGHSVKEKRVISLAEQGLIEYIGNSRIRTTPEGAIVLNAVIADLAA